jgi:hypothetical protein
MWTEEQEAANMAEQLQIDLNRRRGMRGFSFLWSTVVLMALGVSWSGWAWLAIHDHARITTLEQELHAATDAPAGTFTRRGIKVDNRLGEWIFTAWTWNHAAHSWELATYNVCPGRLPLTDEIQTGVTIRLWQWQEDQAHRCMNISNPIHSGYTLERNSHGTATLAAYAGPPTGGTDYPAQEANTATSEP